MCRYYIKVLDAGEVDATKVAHRPRESPYPIITVEEAVSTVIKHTHVLGTEEVFYKSKLKTDEHFWISCCMDDTVAKTIHPIFI